MTPELPFSEHAPSLPLRPVELTSGSDEHFLARHVGTLTFSRGGAEVHELLDWTLAQGWSPSRYYLALQKALNSGLLTDLNGLLLKNFAK